MPVNEFAPPRGTDAAPASEERYRIGHWIWEPWYAKLWWFAIPAYWVLIFSMPRGLVYAYVWSGFVALLNLFFMPVTAFLILGFGFLWRRFDPEWTPADDAEEPSNLYAGSDGFGCHDPTAYLTDVHHPLSPLNPANPAHPSRYRHRN